MMKSATMPHQRTLRKRMQTQCLQVEVLNQFRITGKQDLKPAIQSKPIHLVGANSPTWCVFRLQQLHGQPRTLQTHRTAETRQSCPHDCYVVHGRQFATPPTLSSTIRKSAELPRLIHTATGYQKSH